MLKRILVLFALIMIISCRQNTATILSAPPTENNEITDEDNTDGGNTDGDNIDGGLWYGYYDVSILQDDGSILTVKYSISDTEQMFYVYRNMIIDSITEEPKFELSKNNSTSQTAEDVTTAEETYTFDSNLNLIKKDETTDGENKNATSTTISKKFRGVCLVRIYPDAKDKLAKSSSLLGSYTVAGVYTEMPTAAAGSSYRAMTKSEEFQNIGYDELIILRPDITVDIKSSPTGYANEDVSEVNYNYRADILFDTDEGINFYYYNPDRTFEKQNTNFIFKRIVKTATE
ncbi:hypothetical protein [uncultured Brachyspira sp.]|uniref:hypothetical protein n=1 Tax=uncultured Brachyspira sp. TaxID=221953 RepID=UPI00262BE894|nr:hypothetical protein [uncultured Brachyspira sp.]